MATSFSLLRLPNKERLQVLRCMDGRTLLLFSLISLKTKDLVKSVQMKPSRFQVTISEQIRLIMSSLDIFITFCKEPQEDMKVLEKPDKVRITGLDSPRTAREFPNLLEIKEWYEHILDVINARQATQMILYQGCERFDMETIRTIFGKINHLHCSFQRPINHAREVLRVFGSELEKLKLSYNPFPQGDIRLHKILIQNLNELELGLNIAFERLDLEDLLICNAHHIKFSLNQQFDNINQFLKLWIKGANKRLRTLTIDQRTYFVPTEILKGIRIISEIPREENIVYEGNIVWYYGHRRAMDIRKNDGTRGTVIMYPSKFFFLVWN